MGGSGESGGNESDNSTEESVTQRTETLRKPVGGLLHPKPKDEVALRKSRDLSAHRSSISGNKSGYFNVMFLFLTWCNILGISFE